MRLHRMRDDQPVRGDRLTLMWKDPPMRPQYKRGMWRRLARISWLTLGLAGGCCWSDSCTNSCGGGCCDKDGRLFGHRDRGYKSGDLRDPGHEPAPNGSAVMAWDEEQANRA